MALGNCNVTAVPEPVSSLRKTLGIAAFLVIATVLLWELGTLLTNTTLLPPDDFVEYWAAGRLNLQGHNPYDPELLLPLQQAAGRRTDEAIMMWNPPWTLTLAMPLGLLPARIGQLTWTALLLVMIVGSAQLIWRYYGAPADRRIVAVLMAIFFMPSLTSLQIGQIGPVLLLGLAGFLFFEGRKQDFIAGVVASLLAIKPHLVYLFWIALPVWAVTQRRWRVLAGGITAGMLATLLPLALNPQVIAQYRHALLITPPAQWFSPTPGAFLRRAFGWDHFWLQFVPNVVGVVWFLPYWYRRRRTWNWGDELPVVLLASFATAAYGAWPFDVVVLLLPVVQAAIWTLGEQGRPLRRRALLYFLAIDGLILTMELLHIKSLWYVWEAPVILVAYLDLRRLARMQSGRHNNSINVTAALPPASPAPSLLPARE